MSDDQERNLAKYEFIHDKVVSVIYVDGVKFEHIFRRPGLVDEKNKESAMKFSTFSKPGKDKKIRTITNVRLSPGMIAYYNSLSQEVVGYQLKDDDPEDARYALSQRIDPGDGSAEKDWPTVKDLIPAPDKVKSARKIYNGYFSIAEKAGVKRTRSVRIGRLTAIKWEPFTGEEDEEVKAAEREEREKEAAFEDFDKFSLPAEAEEEDKPGVYFLYGEPDALQLKFLEKLTTGASTEEGGGETQEIVTDLDTVMKLRPLLKEVHGGLVNGEIWDSSREDHRDAIPLALYKTGLILFWHDYKKQLGNS